VQRITRAVRTSRSRPVLRCWETGPFRAPGVGNGEAIEQIAAGETEHFDDTPSVPPGRPSFIAVQGSSEPAVEPPAGACLRDDARLKAGGAACAFDHLGAGALVVWDHPVAVRLVSQSGGARASGYGHAACGGGEDDFFGGQDRGEEPLRGQLWDVRVSRCDRQVDVAVDERVDGRVGFELRESQRGPEMAPEAVRAECGEDEPSGRRDARRRLTCRSPSCECQPTERRGS
jgi:hypothetical protein